MDGRAVAVGRVLVGKLAGLLMAAALASALSGCGEADSASAQPQDTSSPSDAATESGGDKAADTATSTATDVPDATAAGCEPACATGYTCDASVQPPVCVSTACVLPTSVSADVWRLTALQLLPVSAGCDMEGDGKPNNRLGKLVEQYAAINAMLGEQIAAGQLNLLLAVQDPQVEGGAFAVSWLVGDLTPDQAGCAPAEPKSGCSYTIRASSYDSSSAAVECPASSLFDDATLGAGGLLAGSSGKTTLRIPFSVTGIVLDLTLRKARLTATTVDPDLSGDWTDGKICGAVLKSDGAGSVGAAACAPGECDVDLDGDGVMDALSVAFSFAASKAQVVGVSPQP